VNIVVVNADKNGLIDPADVDRAIDKNTKLISMCHVTFDTGTILPAREIGKIAREHEVPYLLDGAQAVGAIDVDVKDIGCHFYAIAGQKFLGAGEGTGALYFEKTAGEKLAPLIISGPYTSAFVPGMAKVEAAPVTSPDGKLLPPYKFETASLNYPGIVGLATATKYLNGIGIDRTSNRIRKLVATAFESLRHVSKLSFVGTADVESRLFASFEMKNLPNPKVTAYLQEKQIICRALDKCVRACLHFINTEEEIEELRVSLEKLS
jgi:selenocysteine lyase/cysteine desulfurase